MGVCSTTDWMGLGGVFVVPVLVAAVLSQQCNPVTSGGSETCAAHKPNSPSIDATTEPSSTSSSGVLELTEESFDHHVGKDNKAYLVMWSLPSCGHCKKFLPEFAKAAEWILREETAHQFIAFAKVNAHQAPTLTARYGILSYPTLQLFRGGNTPPETIQIGRSQRAIVQYVNKLFSLSLPVPQRSSRLRNSAVLDATDDFEKLLDEHLSEYVSVVVLWSSASKQSDLLRRSQRDEERQHHNPQPKPLPSQQRSRGLDVNTRSRSKPS
eukprot:c20748_g1_i16.p1 GENE.c20748_g1_i16~~c20748_g1_i16.p1  ORF type:complete len:268 (+),score=50.33 c20748_g1_i16:1-804(+)